MGPTRYWMLNRRKLSDEEAPLFTLNTSIDGGCSSSGSYYESWEECAFAKDDHGGFMCPPRPYSCSFCSQKFQSSQALGGHMNMHRREKARLRLSLMVHSGETVNKIMGSHHRYMIHTPLLSLRPYNTICIKT